MLPFEAGLVAHPMGRRAFFGVLSVSLLAALWISFAAAVPAQTNDDTGRAALAILDKNCISCHGAAQMSGLDMRQRDGLLKGGKRGPAITPGKPAASLLYLSAAHQGALKMPLGSTSPFPTKT